MPSTSTLTPSLTFSQRAVLWFSYSPLGQMQPRAEFVPVPFVVDPLSTLSSLQNWHSTLPSPSANLPFSHEVQEGEATPEILPASHAMHSV